MTSSNTLTEKNGQGSLTLTLSLYIALHCLRGQEKAHFGSDSQFDTITALTLDKLLILSHKFLIKMEIIMDSGESVLPSHCYQHKLNIENFILGDGIRKLSLIL